MAAARPNQPSGVRGQLLGQDGGGCFLRRAGPVVTAIGALCAEAVGAMVELNAATLNTPRPENVRSDAFLLPVLHH